MPVIPAVDVVVLAVPTSACCYRTHVQQTYTYDMSAYNR
jgi:hypothetical protein